MPSTDILYPNHAAHCVWIGQPNEAGKIDIVTQSDGNHYSLVTRPMGQLTQTEIGTFPSCNVSSGQSVRHTVPINAIASPYFATCFDAIPRNHLCFNDIMSQCHRQFGHDMCICFRYQGLLYVVPYFVIICAVVSRISPLCNALLDPNLWASWVIDCRVVGNTTNISFSANCPVTLLRSKASVAFTAWLCLNSDIRNWQQTVIDNHNAFCNGTVPAFGVPFPAFKRGNIIIHGFQYGNRILVTRMQYAGMEHPFDQIDWSHPLMSSKNVPDPNPQHGSSTTRLTQNLLLDPDNAANDDRHVSRATADCLTDFFDCKMRVQHTRPDAHASTLVGNTGPCVGTKDMLVTTNASSREGTRRPCDTIPPDVPDSTNKIELIPEFSAIAQALDPLTITNIDYSTVGSILFALITLRFEDNRHGARTIVVVEGLQGKTPFASTLILLTANFSAALLPSLIAGGHWDLNRLDLLLTPYDRLRHLEDRGETRWHHLFVKKFCNLH